MQDNISIEERLVQLTPPHFSYCSLCAGTLLKYEMKPIQCSQCPFSAQLKPLLENHISSVHGVKNDLTCDKCGKLFAAKGTVKRHIITVHEGRKDFKCNICGKSFSTKQYLTVHYSKKHLYCQECNDLLTDEDALHKHNLKNHRVKYQKTLAKIWKNQ